MISAWASHNRSFWICSSWTFPEHILTWNRTFCFMVMVLLSGTSCQIFSHSKIYYGQWLANYTLFVDFGDMHSKMPSQKWLTSHTKIYVPVMVTERPAKYKGSCQCRLNAGPLSATLAHHWTSPDQTPLTDGMRVSVLHNYPHWGGTIIQSLPAQCGWFIKSVHILPWLSDYLSINNIALNAIQTTCYLKTTQIIRPGRKPGAKSLLQ